MACLKELAVQGLSPTFRHSHHLLAATFRLQKRREPEFLKEITDNSRRRTFGRTCPHVRFPCHESLGIRLRDCIVWCGPLPAWDAD